MNRILGFAVGYMALLAIGACQATEQAASDNKLVKLGEDEIREVLTGNTMFTARGGVYYFSEDGFFDATWKGDPATGTWYVENDFYCYDVEDWGGEWCYNLYWDGDELVGTRLGKSEQFRGGRIEEGKQL